MQQQNPFNSNPLTRNRVLPTVMFVKPSEAKTLTIPAADSCDPSKFLQNGNNMPVPNQLPDPTAAGERFVQYRFVQYDKSPLTKNEWTKWRFIEQKNEHGDWGDAWGKKEFAKEIDIDRKSAIFTQRSKIENAKLSAELEKDEFRKQLLADIDSGKLFPNTRLEEVDESHKVQHHQNDNKQQVIKENKDGSDSNQQRVH